MDRRKDFESMYEDCMQSYRRLWRGGIALAIFAFTVSVMMFGLGIYRIWNDETLLGFLMFLLCSFDFCSGVQTVKRNKKLREDMHEMEVSHKAVMMVMGHFEEFEKEEQE